ncbi:MAG: hemerythrin domain-containing protein [Candidatus Eisenbacteria bacterium]|nr:hemerythrin domain-containing protein [Candidatus Eisenbacteria bacterium]
MNPNTVFERMRADHQRVLAEIAELERIATGLGDAEPAAPGLERMLDDVVRMLELQFDTHMAAEDEVLFPALTRSLPETLGPIAPLRAEHQELRSMLAVLAELLRRPGSPGRDEQLAVQVRDFVDLLRIHIRKEEAVVFRVAEHVLAPPELQALADRMDSGAGGPPAAPPAGA